MSFYISIFHCLGIRKAINSNVCIGKSSDFTNNKPNDLIPRNCSAPEVLYIKSYRPTQTPLINYEDETVFFKLKHLS